MKSIAALETLEFLLVGIHEKCALWRALSLVAVCDPRFQGTDFEQFAMRAKNQHDKSARGSNVRAQRSVCPPNNWIGAIRPRFTTT